MLNKIVFMETMINYSQQAYFKGSIIKEYLLVVNPEADVWQQVMNEKMNFFSDYGDKAIIKKPPHITIASFSAKEEMETTLLKWMRRVISTQQCFKVALNNYGGFPNVNTIYLRVQDQQPFQQIARELKVLDQYINSNGLPKAQLISYPHMTIAKKLKKETYEKAVMEYSKKEFHAEFEVKELLLLKRSNEFESCKQVSLFRLIP